jgi:copper homeostasis protein
MIIKEACIETQDEFDRAFLHHADQYEICSQLELGGLTPSLELVKYASTKTKHSLVMIRRKNDFSSDSSHTQELLKDIKSFINLNIQGFVFGFLNNKNEVDINTTQTLVEACGNKEIVFHMAFDKIIN